MSHHDRSIFGNFMAVLGALVIMAIVFFYIASDLGDKEILGSEAAIEEAVRNNIQPIGKVTIAGDSMSGNEPAEQAMATETAAAEPRSGKAIYNGACVGCHGTGVAGAPKPGDTAAWEPRMANGMDSLLQNVTNGLNAMPPKGLCMDCSDTELKAAINFMIGS